uniref:basic phospholipase A2-like n=1 Tax=Euleptes europaea TaxID=460621 RepID=UPI0025413012|nr:basic phospholipase A2-like [Euleptes europaea]
MYSTSQQGTTYQKYQPWDSLHHGSICQMCFSDELCRDKNLLGADQKWQAIMFVPTMKQLSFLVILVANALATINSSPLNFRGMIQKITGRNTLIYFNGYGCYCGKDGKGKPKDGIDMCCFHHECCYERLQMHKCHPLIDHYTFLIVNDDVLCENGEKTGCPTRVCECDREVSLCFRREAKTYNKSFHHYPAVLCKEVTHKCPPSEEVVQKENLTTGPQSNQTLT